MEGRPFLKRALRHASVLTVSTPPLAEALGKGKTCIVVPNRLDDRIWRPVPPVADARPVVIGFVGTPTHAEDLSLCVPALRKLAEVHGDTVNFLFMGCSLPELSDLPNSRTTSFQTDYPSYVEAVRKAGIHIGIAPLRDSRFNRSKSAIKWMDLSICGIAGIFADLEPYRGIVENGVNGILAGQDWECWYAALDSLVRNPAQRFAMATRAQKVVMADHTLSASGQSFPNAIRTLIAQSHSRPETLRQGPLRRLRNFLWL